jgi:WD repeat-containing protein 35
MIFWDVKKNSRSLKYVKNLLDVASCGSFCLLTAKVADTSYILILCNSIGSPVDNRIINIEPEYICLTETHVIVASKSYVYVWQFRNQQTDLNPNHYGQHINIDLLKKTMMKEVIFFVEDVPNMNESYNMETYAPTKNTGDAISAIHATEK